MPKKVLIVDDRAGLLALREMLRGEFETLEAAYPGEALSVLKRDGGGVCAVILDLDAARVGGLELLRRLKSEIGGAAVPIIVCAQNPDEETERLALELGASDFMQKPYRAAVARRRVLNAVKLAQTRELANASETDKLTGLYNREAFFQRAAELISAREPGHYVLSCLDVDNFKVINDQYGSAKGDEVLRFIAGVLHRGFGEAGGVCCRVAADNFAALYPRDFMDSGEADRVRLAAAGLDGSLQPVTISAGRYVVDDLSLAISAMYDRAVLAAATVKGRFDVQAALYDESMRRRLLREQEIIDEMKPALESGQFEAWFQPQYNHSTGALIGAEALARWRHPQKGLIPPGEFIPIFERSGFVYELDKFIWRRVCERLRRWLDEGREPLPVSVNISRYDLFREGLVDVFSGLLERFSLPVELLRLEITESAFASSGEQVISVVRRLHELGFTVEIDDFGSGYSSLNTLKNVPAEVLKLDMRFLEDNGDSNRGGNILESVVRMAKWIDMAVIAEGVETIEQAEFLKTIGCSYVQGFLYARPMPCEEYEKLASGASKEGRLFSLETVETLDNNAFWDPRSLDTLIFNSYVGGACIFEYHAGSIELLRVNPKYAQVIGSAGMSMEDALKLNWADHLDEENHRALLGDLHASIDEGCEVTGEYVFLNLPGGREKTYLRSTMRVIAHTEDRYLIYCTNENITAQREAEIKETKLSEQLAAIMANINGGVTAAVIDKGAPKLLFANAQYYAQLGYTKELYEREVENPHELIHPDDRERVVAQTLRASELEEPFSSVYRIVRRDGAVRWLQSNISITALPGVDLPVQLAVANDITAQREAEQRERKTAGQLRAIMDHVSSGVTAVITRGEQVEYLFANDRYYELFGFTREQYKAEAKNTFDLIYFEDRERVLAAVEQANKSGETAKLEYRAMRRDGGVFWLRCAISVTHFEGMDEPVQLAIFTDVTAEKRSEIQISEDDEQLRFLNDVAGDLLAGADAESGLESVLRKTLDYFGASRAFIYEYDRERGLCTRTCEACADDVKDMPKARESFSLEAARYWLETFKTTNFLHLHDVGSLPNERAAEREFLSSLGARSALAVSLRAGGVVIGTMGVFNPTAHLDHYGNLAALGDYTAVILTRRDLNAKIERERENLKKLMNDMPGGFARMRVGANGSVSTDFVNDGLCRLRGMSAEEILSYERVDITHFIHPDDVETVRASIKRILETGESHSVKYRLLNSKGEYIWFIVFGRVSDGENGERFINVYYADVSEQEKQELSVRDMLPVVLAAVMESSSEYSFVKDKNLAYVCCSRAFAKMAGKSDVSDVVGKTDYELFERSLADKYRADDVKLLASGESVVDYVEFLPPEKGMVRYSSTSKYPLRDAFGDIIGLYGSGRDITERREAYSRLKLLTDSIPGGIATYACSDAGVAITYFNDGFCELVGCSREEYEKISKTSAMGMVDKDDVPTLMRKLDDLIKTNTPIDCTYRLHAKNSGECKWVNLRGIPGERYGGTVMVYAVLFDVSDRVRIEEQLRVNEEELRVSLSQMGKMIFFYDIPTRTLTMPETYAKSHGLPSVLENVPEVFRERGLVLSADNEGFNAFYEAILRGEQGCSAEAHMRGKDGAWLWERAESVTIFDSQGKPVKAIISVEDVSEEHSAKAEAESVRRNEALLKLVVEHSARVIYKYDVETHAAVSVEPKTSEAMGLPDYVKDMPESLIEQGVIVPDDAEYVRNLFATARSRSAVESMRFRVRNSAGEIRWLDVKYTFIRDEVPTEAVISCLDITEQHEREVAYARYRQATDESAADNALFFETDITANLVERQGGELLPRELNAAGLSHTVVVAYLLKHHFLDSNREQASRFLSREHLLTLYADGQRELTEDWQVLFPDGASHWVRCSFQMVADPYTGHVKVFTLLKDVSLEKRLDLEMQQRAETDGMTGLLNRATAEAQIRKALESGAGRCALLMLDLDDLKGINDKLGHAQGDAAIKAIADNIKASFRKTDVVGRAGGDEFIVFLRDVPNEAKLRGMVVSMLGRLSGEYVGENRERAVHCSIGGALCEIGSTTFEELFRQADAALYHVKRAGKNSFAFYTPAMQLKDYHHTDPRLATLRDEEMFGKSELKRLLAAFSEFFPLILSVNLTQDSFYLMEYQNFGVTILPESGSIDECMKITVDSVHPEERTHFAATFARSALLAAYRSGERSMRFSCRQRGREGYRWVEINLVFYEDDGDVCDFTMVRPIAAEKQRELELLGLHKIVEIAVSSSFEFVCLIHADTGQYERYGGEGPALTATGRGVFSRSVAEIGSRMPEAERVSYIENSSLPTVSRRMIETGGHYHYRYRLEDGEREAEFYYCEPTRSELLMTVRKLRER